MKPLSELSADALRGVGVVFSDIDDTITTARRVPPRVLELARALKDAGVALCLVTGRPAGFGDTLTTYFDGIACAITENGGVLSVDGASDYVFDDLRGPHRAATLARAVEAVRARFPDLRPDPNNYMRRSDFAFRCDPDDGERVRAIEALVAPLGAGVIVSSIQVHLFVGAHTKGTAVRKVSRERFPGVAPEQILTMGDSPNDAAMFDAALFPLSVGVANIRRFAAEMTHRPRYVAQGEGADGAVEVFSRLLAARGA
jgi:HAD superfamily hydrolase (TIGR01484 family)